MQTQPVSGLRLAEAPLWIPHPEPANADLLYAPLGQVLLELNSAGRAFVERLLTGVTSFPDSASVRMLDKLAEVGLLTHEPDLCSQTQPGGPDDGRFAPCSVTLCLTGRCNLRCKYCYAHGGTTPHDMPWGLARAAMDTVIQNARQSDRRHAGIAFHGGGEPTQAMNMLRRCVDYARSACRDVGVECRLSLGTNGFVAPDSMRWIARNIANITMSIDGIQELQDLQRPKSDGGSSWDHVIQSARILDDCNASYGLRVTVTRRAQDRMPEIVSCLARVTRATRIQFEPMDDSGRGALCFEDLPQPEAFVNGFLAAWHIARAEGRELETGGTNPRQITHQYCSLCQDSMVLSERGLVSTCYEVLNDEDPRRTLFAIGAYRDGRLSISEPRALDLRSESLELKDACRNCWARYSCAGDCHAKVARRGPPGQTVDRRRCYMIQEIARARILECYGFPWPGFPSQHFHEEVRT